MARGRRRHLPASVAAGARRGMAVAAAALLAIDASALTPKPPTAQRQHGRSLLWGGGGGGFFGNPTNGNDHNAAFNQFGGGMANSAFYGGRYGPIGAFGNAGNVACGTVGLAYNNVPCTGRQDRDPQLNNAYGIGGRTAPGGVLPGVLADSIPQQGSSGAQPYGGSPFANTGQYGGFIGGLPSAGGVYGGGPVYGPNVGLVSTPGIAPLGRRLLRALKEEAGKGWW